jgi:hypothetical protein
MISKRILPRRQKRTRTTRTRCNKTRKTKQRLEGHFLAPSCRGYAETSNLLAAMEQHQPRPCSTSNLRFGYQTSLKFTSSLFSKGNGHGNILDYLYLSGSHDLSGDLVLQPVYIYQALIALQRGGFVYIVYKGARTLGDRRRARTGVQDSSGFVEGNVLSLRRRNEELNREFESDVY